MAENPSLETVELSNWGEMFLNPELLAVLRIAHARGVLLEAKNGVDLNFAREDVLDGLVRYGFGRMTCSIDGATWQFVIFGHNQHEIVAARDLAQSLDMAFQPKLAWGDMYDEPFSPVRDNGAARAALGVVDRDEHLSRRGRSYARGVCMQLWHKPQVSHDGRVLGCCVNHWRDFGNAFTEGLATVLDGERMGYARAMLQGRAAPRADIACTTCSEYDKLAAHGDWLSDPEVAVPPPSWRDAVKQWLRTHRPEWLGPLRALAKRLRSQVAGMQR